MKEALELNSVVAVPYGDVDIIPKDKTIQTQGLYACLGVVLMDEKKVVLAHIPTVEPFAVCDYDTPGHIVVNPRTFEQLTDKLLYIFGNKTENTHACLVGGVKDISEETIKKITDTLVKWGLRKEQIELIGPHDKEAEWSLIISQGKLFVQSKKYMSGWGETTS